MTNKTKYMVLIACAAIIGGATEAAGLFPSSKELLMALNLFMGAILIFVGKSSTPTT